MNAQPHQEAFVRIFTNCSPSLTTLYTCVSRGEQSGLAPVFKGRGCVNLLHFGSMRQIGCSENEQEGKKTKRAPNAQEISIRATRNGVWSCDSPPEGRRPLASWLLYLAVRNGSESQSSQESSQNSSKHPSHTGHGVWLVASPSQNPWLPLFVFRREKRSSNGALSPVALPNRRCAARPSGYHRRHPSPGSPGGHRDRRCAH